MTRLDYLKFCISIKNRLLFIGCELLEKVNDKYMKIRHADELIYIPLGYYKFVNIYYVKDNKIIEVYRDSGEGKYRNKVLRYYKFHKQRNYRKILESDDSTKIYF